MMHYNASFKQKIKEDMIKKNESPSGFIIFLLKNHIKGIFCIKCIESVLFLKEHSKGSSKIYNDFRRPETE